MICCAVTWCVALAPPEAQYCAVHTKRPDFQRPQIVTADDPALTECTPCKGTGECQECDGMGTCQDACGNGHHCEHECEECDGTGDCPDCDGAFRDVPLSAADRKYLVWAQAGPIEPRVTEQTDWEPW